jgi:hypothetical protein
MSVPCSVVTIFSGCAGAEHLLRDPGAGRVRDGVVHVQQVQLVAERHLVHHRRQRQRVVVVLEERVAGRLHLVEEDPLHEVREPEGLRVGDEVDLVPRCASSIPSSVAMAPEPP